MAAAAAAAVDDEKEEEEEEEEDRSMATASLAWLRPSSSCSMALYKWSGVGWVGGVV